MTTTTAPVSSNLSRLFSPITRPLPRLALSVEALDKCGKTHFALMTPPTPLVCITTDPGTAAIAHKAKQAGRDIHLIQISWNIPPVIKAAAEIDKAEWAAWIKAWGDYKAAVAAVQAEKGVRTLVKDNESDIWALAQLAYYGKSAGNSNPDVRTKLNNDYEVLFRNLYNSRPDLNIILIHKLKKQYERQADRSKPAEWSGRYETDGFNRVGFQVDLTYRLGWDEKLRGFYAELDRTKAFRQLESEGDGANAQLLNKRWGVGAADPVDFPTLAMEVFPETIETPEVWGL